MRSDAQSARLKELLRRFKEDSGEYRDMVVPEDDASRRRALRSLMNIRMPAPMDPETLRLQDEYLAARTKAVGTVGLDAIPTVGHGRHGDRLSLWQGDITRLAVDAIVNAANSQMLGCFVPMHTCIDNCIHTYAGIQLRAECAEKMAALRKKHGPDYEQPTAVPMLTEGYNLPAKKVVHVVGPIVYSELTESLEQDLERCYRNVLDVCRENSLRSVAFCCISTGVFRFPADRAAEIAVNTARGWLDENGDTIDRVVFNVFTDADRRIYEKLLEL